MVEDLDRRQWERCWKQALQQQQLLLAPIEGRLYRYDDETKTYAPLVALDMGWMDEPWLLTYISTQA